MPEVLSDRWLLELARLRDDPDGVPVERRAMRMFLRKTPAPSLVSQLANPPEPPGIEYATVAIYDASEPDAPATILVPIASEDCRHLPLVGHVDVRGVIAPGHALTLSYGVHTVACAGPSFVPFWSRRYRNRPQRRPPLGAWAALAGSEVDGR